MNDKEFMKEFDLHSDKNIDLLKVDLYEQFRPYYIRGAGNTLAESASSLYGGGFKGFIKSVGTIFGLIGSSSELGYDYKPHSTNLVGIYEIK